MVDIPGTPPPPMGEPARGKREPRGKGILWAVMAVVVAFAIGFFWQWYVAGQVRADLTSTEQALRVERLRVRLAQATLAAQAGDFEAARVGMSEFFTRLQEQRESLPPALAGEAERILERRDDIITGLSRSNPAYADVLYRTLARFGDAAPAAAGATPTPDSARAVREPPGDSPGAAEGVGEPGAEAGPDSPGPAEPPAGDTGG